MQEEVLDSGAHLGKGRTVACPGVLHIPRHSIWVQFLVSTLFTPDLRFLAQLSRSQEERESDLVEVKEKELGAFGERDSSTQR